MKFSTLLLAAHTASVIGTQPDGSALLQLRKMSVLSANNATVSSRGEFNPFEITYVTPCDKDELANQIEDLETERESKSEILKGKTSELGIREALVKSQQSLVNGIKKVLGEKQTILDERKTLVTQIEDTVAATSANLTSYKEQWSAKADELSAAKTALDSARETEKNKKRAWFMAFLNYKQKGQSAAAQTSLVETSKKEVKDAELALEAGEKNANSACATAKDFRAKATAAAAAHDAAVKELETATAQHSAAVKARETRRSEMSAAQQTLDAAKAARASAASKRAQECKEAADADLSESSAEGKYRAKKKICAALEAEEQNLIQAQAAAQVAYDAASGEAESATRAYGRAKKALQVAIAKHKAATDALTDARDSQKEAVAKETSECAKAETAKSVVSKTTSELHQAGEALVKARFADSQADAALTRATSHESTTCDTASKAQCAMNRAKAALDAAKLRYDEAVAKRKSQDQVVTAKNALVASAQKSVEEAESTVKTAQSTYAESEKTKGAAKLAVFNAWKLFRDATFKYGRAVLVQGRAKAAFDTATEQVQCATNRYTSATNDFKLATASKEEKEDAKRICDEDLKAKKNPERAVELMERLQVSYDEVEMALGLWKTTKGKMESLKAELDAKTKYMQAMKADYESKVAYTAKAKALRTKLHAELRKAQVAYDAACKAATAAYEHMVSWQNELEVRVDSHNAAVEVRNKAVQLQQLLLAAEKLAKQIYEDALELWKQKVADHGNWKDQCAAARTAKEAKEAQKEKTADALASAIALVESLQSRLELETVTWETAKSHCRAAGDDRAEMDAAVVLAEKAFSDAEAELKRAQNAKDTAEKQMKAALQKQADAKAALDAAIQAATAKTKESMACDKEEETLRLAWVKADAKAEQEQKQCAAACAALTAANGAVAAAQAAYSTAVTNYENAVSVANSAYATKDDAAAAEAAAEAAATQADELAACKERTCAKKTAEAETLKSELETAKNTLKTQSDVLTQMQSEVAAAQIVLKKAQDASTKAVQDRGAAEGAVVIAQDALDEIENCIDSLEKKLSYLETDLRQAKEDVADSQDLVAKEEKNVAAAQVVLKSYQADVTRLTQEVQSAQAALDAIEKALSDAQATLDACPASRCTPPNPPENWDESSSLPNLVDGATWTPSCESGYKVDYCDDDASSSCGVEVESMTCTDGKLQPATFRCAPILTGSLNVQIKEGRHLSFGEEKLSWSDFEYHPQPSDPYVQVELCPGANPQVQKTITKENSYDAVWMEDLNFRINEAGPCNTFRIAVRDDRTDDESRCEAEAMYYMGAVEKLEVKEMCNTEKTNCHQSALESFMSRPNQEQNRRIILTGGGVLDFSFVWKPDSVGPVHY